MNVHIEWQQPDWIRNEGEEWCDVYDLEIEDVHEYFANGILVHNCDPTALEHVVEAHGDLWVDEEIYSTGLTNPMIAERAKGEGITSQQVIIADCAEPKSIAELKALGLWVSPSPKGADSIISGLDILRRYRIHVTRRSRGLLANMRSYKWDKDRDGNMTNKPEDANNHGIDAIRYVALAKLAVRQKPRGVIRRN
jgi:phage terminase large subunit